VQEKKRTEVLPNLNATQRRADHGDEKKDRKGVDTEKVRSKEKSRPREQEKKEGSCQSIGTSIRA